MTLDSRVWLFYGLTCDERAMQADFIRPVNTL